MSFIHTAIKFWLVLLYYTANHASISVNSTLLPLPTTGLTSNLPLYDRYARETPYDIHMVIPDKDINASIAFGNGVVDRMQRLETNLGWSEVYVKRGSSSHGQYLDSYPEDTALRQGRAALVASKATLHLMSTHCNRYNLNPSDCAKYITDFKLTFTPLQDICESQRGPCGAEESNLKYRTIDGTCNNVRERTQGASFTEYKRLIHPDYLDGVQEPRRSIHRKNSLPSPRLISSHLLRQSLDDADRKMTMTVMQWTQFVSHDLGHTATNKMVHLDNSIECCQENGFTLSPRYKHPFCEPIDVPKNDEFYSKHNIECLPYVRSVPAVRSDCNFGPLEQINQATHYLDASQIYGSDPIKASKLRTYSGGRLKTSPKNERHFLPLSNDPSDDCQTTEAACFLSGDSRVNLQPQLTLMHTVWHREHNRIAAELQSGNADWNDERIYQESRRIVIAEIQSVTYNEWLPVVLGKGYVEKVSKGGYDASVDASVSNSFANAAVRFVTSMMSGKLRLFEENRSTNVSLNLRDYFNKPTVTSHFDELLRGLATQESQKLDLNFAKEVTSQSFYNGRYGFDILSLDIQRGRDHGLPSYTAYRSICGLKKVQTFQDFNDVMSFETIRSLASVYGDPHDVDLFVGGLAERPQDDSLLGPTFSCLIADQFQRTRRGDRYFYENESQPAPFTRRQIEELKRVSLARVYCDNGDDIRYMQKDVFKVISESNKLVSCASNDIPRLNLNLWKEKRYTS